ncbi:MAG: leucine-rich repeat protein, partial [Malacoplasma sp.]|nr:leucine-rich repeat protein [Malacoplasma sp.]
LYFLLYTFLNNIVFSSVSNTEENKIIPLTTDGTNISVHLKDSEETRSISKNDIETVEILTCDPTITTIGNKFLWGYSNLDTFDLSGLTKIKTIGELFLGECYEISSLNWSGLENLEEVGDNFLTQSGTRLTSLDFTGLSSLKKVGEHFADYIQDITSVNLSGLTNLEIIGNNFLFWDGKITSIDLSTLTKLESIGTNFLNMCTGLQTIKLPVVDNIPTLGSWGLGIGRDALTDYISIDCNNEELSATYSTADNWKATSGHFGKTVKWLPQPPAPVYNNSATIAGETFELVDNYTTDMLNWLCPVEGTNSSTINKIFKKDGSEQGEEFNIEELENINICLCDTPTADINEDFLSGAINMVEADISGLSVYDGSDGHKISKNAFKNSYKLEKLNIGSMSTDAFAGVATDYDFACYNWNGQAVPPSNMNKGIEVIGDNALALVNKYEYLFDATAPGKYRHLVTENDCIVLEENSNNVTKEIEVEDKTDLDKLVSEYGGPMNFRYKGDTSYTSVVVKNIRSVSIKKEVDATATCNDFLGGILYSSSLDLSGLTKIKTIGSDFIRGYGLYANALQSIDFNPLANVTDIGDGFLGDCTTLKQLNFNPMKNLETIGTNFLYNCTNLVEVDMSELTSLTNIGDGFIRSSNIQSLYVPLKDPSTITVSSTLFMNWTNAECAIHAGSFADEYKLTTPWDGRSAKIDDQTK